ncbi:pyridoxal-phosphate dependent enzyme [Sorangium sp. So ce1014]|uniref:pyridoxal-phosphate dependent enzyme n=1 Tax=Sorangium sp. So ce1014 TaxID=3133326 RepID=UPI003F600D64
MERSFRRWDTLSTVYDRIFDATTPQSGEGFEAFSRALRFAASAFPGERLSLLDLGCGTGRVGVLAREVLGADRVTLTLVDGSEGMMEKARAALGDDAEYIVAPFESDELCQRLHGRRFHVVSSAFALHHLSAEEKRAQYAFLGTLLPPRGALIILDLVAVDPLAKAMVDACEEELSRSDAWREGVHLGDLALAGVPPNERNRDRPDSLETQLAWMAGGARLEVTCPWRGLEMALLFGRKLEVGAVSPTIHDAAGGICTSVLETIGDTPLVALDRLGKKDDVDGRIVLKLEMRNPGLSKKDRVALAMVLAARCAGDLRPGQPVVELTSGNTGTGLAIACAVLGHPFIAVMSAGNSVERARMMRALGAEVEIVPQHPDSVHGVVSGRDLALVEERTRAIVAERGAVRTDQFEMRANVEAHELGTGSEILRQTGGRVDAFVDFAGSGGTISGVARVLKASLPAVRCYVVEPASARFLAGDAVVDPRHRIQGGGYSRPLQLFDASLCDGYLAVTDEEAIETARRLAKAEGIFAGFSTGANVAAAEKLLRGAHRGGVVACLACDSGLKYLSTDLWP